MRAPPCTVRRLFAPDAAEIAALADLLIDCVEGGASVSFMHPLTRERAEAFWRGVARDVEAGARALLVAEDAQGICGTVQLALALAENQPHRADVVKTLGHRRARERGVGAALMRAAEATALECGKTLLVLDTASDTAERLYEREGWIRVGEIPDFALLPRGGLCRTVVFYRELAPRGPLRVEVAPDGFSSWAAVHALLLRSYAYMAERIDPPSSLLRMSVADLERKARDERPILAFVGAHLVGAAFAAVRDDCVYVGKLAVDAPARRRGVARGIFEAAEALARREGRPCLELETRIELTENHETFAALGFAKVEERAHSGFARPTYVVMRRRLSEG